MVSRDSHVSESDRLFLLAATDLAERGRYTTSPNPCVGCLIMREGHVIGRGWHQWAGQGHAEANAIKDAGGDVRGATVYVSLEPCSFEGRTPSCAQTLIDQGVARVVVAMIDPHPKNSGRGIEVLREAGIRVEVLELPEALALNPGLAARRRRAKPWVRVKVGASLDGRTAMASGESQWITGRDAREDVQRWRARSCAVVTGVGTILADNPRLSVRGGRFAARRRIRQPLRVVLDSRLRTPADAALFDEPGDVLLVHTGEAAEHPRAETISCGEGRVDLHALLEVLLQRDCGELMVEAGSTLTGAFLESGLWDELILFVAPRLLGGSARAMADIDFERLGETIGGTIADVQAIGEDLRIIITASNERNDT